MTDVDSFLDRWSASGAAERANAHLFLTELCDLLEVPRPEAASDRPTDNGYVFERRVRYAASEPGTRGYIDLYREGCFVLEAKQGADAPSPSGLRSQLASDRKPGTATRGTRAWKQAMRAAKNQAYRYAKALPDADGWPPFLLVVDVGHCIDVYADFARQGKNYVPFPTQEHYRIPLQALREADLRDRLRRIWTDPLSLDPSRTATRVTRGLAENLATVARSLENDHDPDAVASFLMRSLFTMFAEDVGLIPDRSFLQLLERCRGNVDSFPDALRSVWQTMDAGGFDPGMHTHLKRFNGHLFKNSDALPITEAQLEFLIEAAEADWSDVEPAIFGTLLERALDPRERHKLGAHFTPRAYVERLVVPTVIEPLRKEWDAAQTAAAQREAEGDEEGARGEIEAFHRRLCDVTVLDPACGSGNFLYVTLEHLKRLEAEVLEVLQSYGGQQSMDMTGGLRVSPEQLLGLEINPRAAAIADVVLWIGYLQWHFRTYGDADRLDPPILKDTGTIQHRDAVLDYDEKVPRTDEDGEPVTKWDGRTYKEHPTTRKLVPDKTARDLVYDYTNPRPAAWPEADFIVGNPPFIGKGEMMRDALGDGYVEALREAYYRKVRQSADFVMFWWYKAALAVRGKMDWDEPAERFGFVSTNSIRQTFNRKVVEKMMKASPPVSIQFAIPDHPWVADRTGADVRIAMTVGAVSDQQGTLQEVIQEEQSSGVHWDVELQTQQGTILADLRTGADVAGAEPLEANDEIASFGMMLSGSGFKVTPSKAKQLGLNEIDGLKEHIRPYRHGRDLTQIPRGLMVIDLYGLTAEEVRERFPAVYQHVKESVKPERDENRRKSTRENWWIFGETRPTLRASLNGLKRYIATPETTKHRFFQFLDIDILPDHMLIAFGLDDAFHLGVLSSRLHTVWAAAAGGRMGVGNDLRYTKTQCFDPFPFPDATDAQQARIRDLGEQLDRHRKERLEAHDDLTVTDLYNVLEKERAGESLDADEREIHEQGLVGILKEIHDDLDAAVADAYGWPAGLPEEKLLQKLVDLNARRTAEEEEGNVRWLRPEYQAPEEVQTQARLELDIDISSDGEVLEPMPWPAQLKERAQAIRMVMEQSDRPLTVDQVAKHFHRARRRDVRSLLDTLRTLGLVEQKGEAFVA